jgi:TRAP-type uncharacterized transport system fused permease subunit
MGLPIAATYVMLVILIAPAMISAGVLPISAHMFMNFFAAMSFVTPPVAIAAYVAAGIAQCDPIRVGFIAVRLGIAAYLVPFYFAYRPALLLVGSPAEIAYAAMIATLGILAATMALAGFAFQKLNIVQRILMGFGSLALLWPAPLMDIIGLGLFGLMILWNWLQRKRNLLTTIKP